jgi:hypothetical protein
LSNSRQKVVKSYQKLSKTYQKLVKKLSKSCQKVFKKLSKNGQKICSIFEKGWKMEEEEKTSPPITLAVLVPPNNYFGPTSAKPSDKHSKPKLKKKENLKEWYEESRIDEEWYRLMMNLGIRRPYVTSSHLVKIRYVLIKLLQ